MIGIKIKKKKKISSKKKKKSDKNIYHLRDNLFRYVTYWRSRCINLVKIKIKFLIPLTRKYRAENMDIKFVSCHPRPVKKTKLRESDERATRFQFLDTPISRTLGSLTRPN